MFYLLLESEHNFFFVTSKLFLFGKCLNTKHNLQMTLAVDDKVQFDAVPCERSENDNTWPWYATVIRKVKKPNSDYGMTVYPFTGF
jgi:hypothetical protein